MNRIVILRNDQEQSLVTSIGCPESLTAEECAAIASNVNVALFEMFCTQIDGVDLLSKSCFAKFEPEL